MNKTAENYTVQEEESFLRRNLPTVNRYQAWKRSASATTREIQEAEDDLALATNTRADVLTKDSRPLAWPNWLVALTLLSLAGVEIFVNYLAAAGLLQDETITYGVTAALTLIIGYLVFGIAREYRFYRSDERVGTISRAGRLFDLGWWFVTLCACGVVYLALSLFLRERYFAQDNVLQGLGAIVSNPWLISGTLTLLAGIFIVAIVYIVSHVNHDLAKANAQIALTTRRLPKLKAANKNALDHVDQAALDLDTAARLSQTNVLRRLGDENLLEDEDAARALTARAILEHFRSCWRDIAGGSPSTPAVVASPKQGDRISERVESAKVALQDPDGTGSKPDENVARNPSDGSSGYGTS